MDGGQQHRVHVPEAGWIKGLLVEARTGGLSLTEDLCTQHTQYRLQVPINVCNPGRGKYRMAEAVPARP